MNYFVCVCVSVTMGIKAALPKYELYFYSTVLGLAMIWAASWIFEVSSCEYNMYKLRQYFLTFTVQT